MRIVFFGTPKIAASILEALLKAKVDIVGVVTQTAKRSGRGQMVQRSAVALVAEQHALALFEPEKASAPDFIEKIAALRADLAVVVAYGKILTQKLLDTPRFGCINAHASLLPKYRGAAPMQRALMAGDTVTGVTIMKMVRALDAGDMLVKREIPIPEEMSLGDLERAMEKEGAVALLEALKLYHGQEPKGQSQDESLVTYAEKITPEDRRIDWKASASSIHNKVRGLSPRPASYAQIELNGKLKQVKIFKTQIVSLDQGEKDLKEISFEKAPGRAFKANDRLLVIVGPLADQLLEIGELQLEGKKRLRSAEFLRGLGKSGDFIQLS